MMDAGYGSTPKDCSTNETKEKHEEDMRTKLTYPLNLGRISMAIETMSDLEAEHIPYLLTVQLPDKTDPLFAPQFQSQPATYLLPLDPTRSIKRH